MQSPATSTTTISGRFASDESPLWETDSPYPRERLISLFDLDVSDTTLEAAAFWLVRRANSAIPTRVSFLNADCVNIMHRDVGYREALATSDRIYADGSGVRLAARMAGHELLDNVNGTDLFPILCAEAAQSGVGIYLFGAKPGRAAMSGRLMQQLHPALTISGSHHGYIDEAGEDRLIDEINASSAGIVLVALGAPRQELWLRKHAGRLNAPVVIGVGGLFDYYSGSIPRAPLVLRRLGLEWTWRLAMEPRRLARRYIIGNAEFLLRVLAERLRSKPSKPADHFG